MTDKVRLCLDIQFHRVANENREIIQPVSVFRWCFCRSESENMSEMDGL